MPIKKKKKKAILRNKGTGADAIVRKGNGQGSGAWLGGANGEESFLQTPGKMLIPSVATRRQSGCAHLASTSPEQELGGDAGSTGASRDSTEA